MSHVKESARDLSNWSKASTVNTRTGFPVICPFSFFRSSYLMELMDIDEIGHSDGIDEGLGVSQRLRRGRHVVLQEEVSA